MRKNNDWQSYLIRVVSGDETGWSAFLLQILLNLLEFIYLILLRLHFSFRKHYRLPIPVISVGNLLVGGTGKTPTVIWLTKLLLKNGHTPAILTRGYHGRHQTNGISFKSHDLSNLTTAETGDEPYLLAKLLPDTWIIVGRERYRNGLKALKDHPEIDLFILDDGFQHWDLERNLDLVLIDAARPFGNRHLLPRGFLREPLSSLKRAGIILLTRVDKVTGEKLTALTAEITAINPQVPLAFIQEENTYLLPLPGLPAQEQLVSAADFLPGRKVSAITGIGNPWQFLASLERRGAEVGYFKAYPDHYQWEETEIIDLIKALTENGFKELIVTAKDSVKIEHFAKYFNQYGLGCYILSLDFKVEDQQVIKKIIDVVIKKEDFNGL